MLITHLAFELGLRRERGDGVDDEEIDGPRPHEHLGDVERLLARVGLRDEKPRRVDADRAGVVHVERVLGVDERADAARGLGLGDGVEREGGLAA